MLPKKATNEENYQYLAGILKSVNVDTQEKAQEHIKGLRDKALKFSSIPLFVIIAGALFFPKLTAYPALYSKRV
jgi:surface polysaccharide O-acyltransferase-like enzyme